VAGVFLMVAALARPAPALAGPSEAQAAPTGGTIAMDPAMKLVMYESQKKQIWLGLMIELILPSGGLFYAENYTTGALVLAGTVVGIGLSFWGFARWAECNQNDDSVDGTASCGTAPIWIGVLMMLAARIGGIAGTVSSVGDHNLRLQRRLGLQAHLAPAPTADGRGGTLGLRFAF
jgi:hypothetical protein